MTVACPVLVHIGSDLANYGTPNTFARLAHVISDDGEFIFCAGDDTVDPSYDAVVRFDYPSMANRTRWFGMGSNGHLIIALTGDDLGNFYYLYTYTSGGNTYYVLAKHAVGGGDTDLYTWIIPPTAGRTTGVYYTDEVYGLVWHPVTNRLYWVLRSVKNKHQAFSNQRQAEFIQSRDTSGGFLNDNWSSDEMNWSTPSGYGSQGRLTPTLDGLLWEFRRSMVPDGAELTAGQLFAIDATVPGADPIHTVEMDTLTDTGVSTGQSRMLPIGGGNGVILKGNFAVGDDALYAITSGGTDATVTEVACDTSPGKRHYGWSPTQSYIASTVALPDGSENFEAIWQWWPFGGPSASSGWRIGQGIG